MHNKRYVLTQLMKLTFQGLMYVSLFIAFFAILSRTNPQIINLSRTAATTMATFAVMMGILRFVYGGYDIEDKKPRSIFSSVLIATLLTDVVTYFQLQIMNVNPANNEYLILFGQDFWLLCGVILLQIGIIYLYVTLGNRLYFRINPPQKSCIITSSQELALHVAEKMSTFRRRFVLNDVVHYECPDVKETIENHDVVFLAGIPDTEEAMLERYCYHLNKAIYLLAELGDVIISTAEQSILDDTPFLYIHRSNPTLLQLFIKRVIDIAVSILGLLILSPLMLIISAVLLASRSGPVFFRQKRATIHGKVFEIIKFRTMYHEENELGAVSAQENDSRITPWGRVLRKYRLDEIPQLLNVLKGDMSIVGPRPEMLENVAKYEQEVPEFKYRQQMKAGLTGLAQIDGKYNTSPKDKAILDLMYIENFSLVMDLKLMLRTLTIFFRRDSTEGFVAAKLIACPRMRTEGVPQTGKTPSDKAVGKPRGKKPQGPTPEEPVRAAL
ncbi:MAG: exopolysaccharide biosynthesis polyprenyl glycosylphosphotransferase [Clostridiales bacterium]|nr:exopolysaccharide biosynthesis polyprenyl glycosylphosphotransferase [Clostridiales bacterium]